MEHVYILLTPGQLDGKLSSLDTKLTGRQLCPGAWIFPSPLDMNCVRAHVSELTSAPGSFVIVEVSDLVTA